MIICKLSKNNKNLILENYFQDKIYSWIETSFDTYEVSTDLISDHLPALLALT